MVLVVAADDGVMPQTIESINHAKAAGVPVVVALNKSDLPNATEENQQKIYGQLAEHGLNPTAWGGDVEVIRTSAETGEGVTELLEILDLQAEVMELTADYGGAARGTVIEAEMQPGRGSVARVLIQDGQIKVGDFIVIGRSFGRVRDMTDDRGRKLEQAGPATPLELSGIDEVPDAGDKCFVTDTLKRAEEVAEQYRHTEREQTLASKTKVTLDNFADAVKAGQIRELGDDRHYDNTREYVVPPGHFFFMGDNRDQSEDSRATVGMVPYENLVGRAEFLFFSQNGEASFWQFWRWPTTIRWSRLFNGIE